MEFERDLQLVASVLTFAHVAVAGDRAALAGRMADAARRQTDQTDAIPQLRLAVQLEQRNVIVQRLAVVIVVYIGRGHAQRLGAGTAIFTGQIIVTHAHIDGIAGAHNAAEQEERKEKGKD